MTDTSVPAKLDSASLADKLRDRIRSSLGELIPEEQWTALMRAEVDRFLKPRVEGQPGYYQREVPSDFHTIATQVIGEEVRARLKKHLEESPEWKARWSADGGLDCLPKRLEEMIERNLPVLMRECVVNLIAGIAQKSTMDSVMAIEARVQGR